MGWCFQKAGGLVFPLRGSHWVPFGDAKPKVEGSGNQFIEFELKLTDER